MARSSTGASSSTEPPGQVATAIAGSELGGGANERAHEGRREERLRGRRLEQHGPAQGERRQQRLHRERGQVAGENDGDETSLRADGRRLQPGGLREQPARRAPVDAAENRFESRVEPAAERSQSLVSAGRSASLSAESGSRKQLDGLAPGVEASLGRELGEGRARRRSPGRRRRRPAWRESTGPRCRRRRAARRRRWPPAPALARPIPGGGRRRRSTVASVPDSVPSQAELRLAVETLIRRAPR